MTTRDIDSSASDSSSQLVGVIHILGHRWFRAPAEDRVRSRGHRNTPPCVPATSVTLRRRYETTIATKPTTEASAHRRLPIAPALRRRAVAPTIQLRPPTINFGSPIAQVALKRTAQAHPTPSPDRKSTRLNSSHVAIPYAVFCLKKKTRIGSP